MYQLVAIGDPIFDTHVQIADESAECHTTADHKTHLCLDYGAKIPIIDSFQSLGGNAPNVAIGGSKLGMSTALVSTVGDDANGHMAIEAFATHDVNTDAVTFSKKARTRYSIILNYKAERTILSFSEKKSYVWPKPFPETEWVYYTGLSEGYETMQDKLFDHLKKHPTIRLAINPGSYMLKYALDALRSSVSRADILIVNKEEAEQIVMQPQKKAKSIEALLHNLLSLGAHEVVLTDGPNGSYAGTSDELWYLPAYPVPVVAKTGAGDAFSSAYLTARYHGHDIPHALEWGTANSSGVIGAHGPHAGLLDKKGVEKMIQKFKTVQPKQL